MKLPISLLLTFVLVSDAVACSRYVDPFPAMLELAPTLIIAKIASAGEVSHGVKRPVHPTDQVVKATELSLNTLKTLRGISFDTWNVVARGVPTPYFHALDPSLASGEAGTQSWLVGINKPGIFAHGPLRHELSQQELSAEIVYSSTGQALNETFVQVCQIEPGTIKLTPARLAIVNDYFGTTQ